MSDILPVNTQLNQVQEGEPVNQVFSYSLTEVGAELKSILITEYESTPGINISGNSYSGSYESVFNLGNDSLLYREEDDLKSASSWDELPNPKNADLYLWKAPSDLQRTFKYKVVLTYSVTTTPTEGSSSLPTVENKTIEKVYTQLVYGNWSKWAQMLRKYVQDGK